jgi:hypothetical protein
MDGDDMSEEAGFYKRDPDSGELLFAPNGVYGPGFTLLAPQRAEYSYPVDGWGWFETREEATRAWREG